MPRGDFRKRETKKPKRKGGKPVLTAPPVFTSNQVEVVKKKRKPREEEDE